MRRLERLTADNEGMQLSVAMSYSGRSDIAAAAKSIARLVSAGLLDPEQVCLCVCGGGTAGLMDPEQVGGRLQEGKDDVKGKAETTTVTISHLHPAGRCGPAGSGAGGVCILVRRGQRKGIRGDECLQSYLSAQLPPKVYVLHPPQVDEVEFERHLSLAPVLRGVGPPDLLIRTSGEARLSNFLLWELAHAELVFCPAMWPDFDAERMEEALVEFQGRARRFGGRGGEAGGRGSDR